MDNIFELVIIVGGLIIAGIYQLVKAKQEARQREEARQRLHPPEGQQYSRPSPSQPQQPKPAGEGGSILEQFRNLMEAARQAQGPRPTPPQQTRPQPQRQAQRTTRRRPTRQMPLEPEPVREEESEVPQRLVPDAAEESARPWAKKTPSVTRAAAEPGRALSDVIASSRSDLAKAVLLSEILGSPVGQRRGYVPRHRR